MYALGDVVRVNMTVFWVATDGRRIGLRAEGERQGCFVNVADAVGMQRIGAGGGRRAVVTADEVIDQLEHRQIADDARA